MEKKYYPPRVWLPQSAIDAFSKRMSMLDQKHFISVEEYRAIVKPLVEALENECCCPGENSWVTGEPIICDACTALNTYKKQTGE